MVATIDGAAGDAAGSSVVISAPADLTLIGVLRALADVLVVGAGTARAEGYRPLAARTAFAQRRAAAGQRPAAAVALVTRSGDVDALADLFVPDAGTIVL